MRLHRVRVLVAGAVALAIAGSTLAGTPAQSAVHGAAPATLQFNQMGVSGDVAAKALNAIAAQQRTHNHSHAMKSVNFILNWLPNVEFAGLWIAQRYGWWAQAGIDMTYKPWTPAVHPEQDVAARGGNTFGFDSGAGIVIGRAQHIPITALYTDTQRSVFGLTVLANSKIHQISDLRGKKVGYQPHELYVPETMLAYSGFKQSDWTPVSVSFNIIQLTAGRVDAYLTFLTNEPISLQLHGVKTRSFAASQYGFRSFDDVMFTNNLLISQRPGLVRAVTRNVARGFQWAHTHVNATASYTVSRYFPASFAGNTDVFGKQVKGNENLLQQTIELRDFDSFSRDPRGRFSGLMNLATWRATINTLYKYGEIKNKPSASAIFTNRFNPYR